MTTLSLPLEPAAQQTRSASLRTLLTGAALYAAAFAVFTALIFAAPGYFGNDDYYHARISAEIWRQGRLALDFPWLPLTILSADRFVDHHLLFHMFVAPWVTLAGMAGAKLATASIAAGVVLAVWALFRQISVKPASLWALGLFALSTPFLYRMLMIRTQGAALLVLVLALIVLFSRRHIWLVAVGFAFIWLYNGFVLLLGISVLYTAAAWIAERRLEWKPVVYTALGLGLGLVINPYFPNNAVFIYEHLIAKVDFESGVRVGNEWYPYTTGVLMANSAGSLLILALGFLRPSFGGSRRDRIETTLLLVALLTLFMVARSRRFIEYYPAFALLFAAAAWGRGGLDLTAWLPARLRRRWIVPLLAAGTGIAFAGITLSAVYQDARRAESPEYMAGAAAWLEQNAPPGAMVFQTDWDDFPYLFHGNTRSVYTVGLDPTYMERDNRELWNQWVEITQGRVPEPSLLIRSLFGAQYVVSDTRHDGFEAAARTDPHLKLVYRDATSYVWEVLPAG